MFKAFMFLKYIFFFAVDGGVHKVAELICFSWWLSDLRSFPPPPKKKYHGFLRIKMALFLSFVTIGTENANHLLLPFAKTIRNTNI